MANEETYGGDRVDDLFDQISALLPVCDPAHVRAHAYGLLRDLAQEEQRRLNVETQGGGMVGRAKDLAARNFPAPVTLEQAAEACGVSPGVLKRMFLAQTGMTYHQWVQGRRMDRAQELLAGTDCNITQVASDVGYANASKFARAFRDYTGQSPSSWRKAHI